MMRPHMLRTQIYITAEQEARIARQAQDADVSKAEVIRRILDAGLGIDDGTTARIDAIRATAGALGDEDDWETWLARVRSTGADDRLDALGT